MSHCEDFLLVSSVWPAAGSRPEFWWANYEECNYKLLLHCYTVHCTCTTHYITHYTAAFPSTSTSSCSYLSSVTGTAAMFIIRVFILALIPHWTITVYGWETQRQDSSSDCAPPPAHLQQGFIIHKYSFHNATLRVSVSAMWTPSIPTLAGEDTGLSHYPTFHLKVMVTCFMFYFKQDRAETLFYKAKIQATSHCTQAGLSSPPDSFKHYLSYSWLSWTRSRQLDSFQ